MFAEVYPFTRLPRRFRVFDYRCDDSVCAGDIVQVPFRGRTLFALVARVKKTAGTDKRIADIDTVVLKSFCTKEDIARYETIADTIVQSPSTLLYQAFMGIWKSPKPYTRPNETSTHTIPQDIASHLSEAYRLNTKFIQGSIESTIALAYQIVRLSTKQTLILVPHEKEAEAIFHMLSSNHSSACLHGKTKQHERSSIMRNWQNGSLRVLIGTKQSSLLPAKELETVIVHNPTHRDHMQYDRNPRFHARHAVTLLAKQHEARTIFSGHFPPITKEPLPSRFHLPTPFPLVHISAEDQSTGIPFLTETLKSEIESSLQHNKRVIALYNRKGYAKRLQCKACDFIPYCGNCGAVPSVREEDLRCAVCHSEMWIPKNCPSCGEADLRARGIGNKRLAKTWQQAFPNYSVAIIDKQHTENLQADILIVTEYFFESLHAPFKKWNVGLVADVCCDLHMGIEADAGIDIASRIHRLGQFALFQQAKCLVQTWTPTLFQKMKDPERFLQEERTIRSTYGLPPFAYRIRITHKKERNKKTKDILTSLNAIPGITALHSKDRDEYLTKPDKYDMIKPYLQKLPDHCILDINYE